MKRILVPLAALTFGIRLALAAQPAAVAFYLFDGDTPVADATVTLDGTAIGRTSGDGAAHLQLPPGAHELVVLRAGDAVVRVRLDLAEAEDAEVIATLHPDAAPSILLERSAGAAAGTAQPEPAGVPGRLDGRVVGAEDGRPVVGAQIFVSGLPLDIRTDAEGRFGADVPAGRYAVSVVAAGFGSQTLDGVEIAAEATTERTIELTPAGLELPEFVVLEPYIEGSLSAFVEERRTSSAVSDILGAEQISRAGDSDAAGALKRVTGLTLVDGKYVYVRGLGERYSSTLLNGAQVPSPDPTRRVVPLDLFPTDVLSGIVVQKTYSADMPAEFGGGTIQLRTRGVPEAFLFRVSGTVGYADGTTGDDGLRYAGGARDWTGRDDGSRAAPDGLLDPRLPSDPAALQAMGQSLAAQGYNATPQGIGPNTGFAASLGNAWTFNDDWRLGAIAAARYAQSWDTRDEERRTFSLFQDRLLVSEDYVRSKTERAVDSSVFAAFGLKAGELHDVNLTVMDLRQTTDEAQVDQGITGSGNNDRITSLEWVENALRTVQLAGTHSLPALGNLRVDWQVTDADSSRASPNRREYRFTFDEQVADYIFESFNEQRYEQLADAARDYKVDLKLPLSLPGGLETTWMAGWGRMTRDRDSSIRRFRFSGRRPSGPVLDFEDLLQPGNIGPNGLRLQETTLATDSYTASQTLDARYLALDAAWRSLRLNLGVRQEDMLQAVTTVRPFTPGAVPEVGVLDESDRLPAGSLTWAYSDKAQLRVAASTTLSRQDIREQTRANFVDPQLDVRVEGNPLLRQAEIDNLDLRWEYYFNATESVSVALFSKDFTNPIELVSVPASGNLLQIRNADSATNRGIELDLYKSLGPVARWDWLPGPLARLPWQDVYLGANYAWIDSEIDLGDNQGIQTNAVRPLQGQSPYVANLSLSYQQPDGGTEATLLYNVSGARISRVGVSGLPDIYEEPFGQLDFTLSKRLPWDGWSMKLRLRNLLDPDLRLTQGGETYRRSSKGREVAVSVEWRP